MEEKKVYEAVSIVVIYYDAKDVISTSADDEIEMPPINVW